MEMTIEKLKALFKKEGVVKERKPSRNPYRDWIIIFVCGVVLCFCMMLGAGYVFLGVKSGTLFDVAEQSSATKTKDFNEKSLIQVLSLYKARADEYQGIMSSKPAIADPSL
jgi:hypothetical protein